MTAMRCGDPRWKDQNFGFLEMSNFDIYVVESAFGSILVDPKFGSFHVGSPHLMAVTGHSWLTLVGNSNNEVCSPSNNTVLKAFWQKKVLPEQRISYCEGIYKLGINTIRSNTLLHELYTVWSIFRRSIRTWDILHFCQKMFVKFVKIKPEQTSDSRVNGPKSLSCTLF